MTKWKTSYCSISLLANGETWKHMSLVFSTPSYGGDIPVAQKIDNRGLSSRRLGGKYDGAQHFVQQ